MSRNDAQSRYGRITQLVDVHALGVRRVVIIGLGSMGQPIVNQLVRHALATRPPGRLRIVDGDTVSDRNLVGTEYRSGHVGMPKAEAAAQIVQEINPDVNLSYWNHHIVSEDIPSIVEMARRSDLLGLFADSFELMLSISERCAASCTQVMALFGPNADHAEVAFSIPSVTPPISRTMGRRQRQAISSPSAFGCDTAYVASFVSALCLELLLGQADRGKLVSCYADAPLFVMSLRKSWIFTNEPDDIARTVACVHVKEDVS